MVFDNFMRKRFSRLTNRRRICQQDISNHEYHGQESGSEGEEMNRVGRDITFTILWDKSFLKGKNKEHQINPALINKRIINKKLFLNT